MHLYFCALINKTNQLNLRPVAAGAASIEDQASGAVLLVGLACITVVELVLVGKVGIQSVGLFSTEAAASA